MSARTRPPVDGWSAPGQAAALFLRGRTLRASTPVAAVVGTLLSSVNQGSVLLDGDATTATWIRVAFNYAVPFGVCSYGYLAARRRPSDALDRGEQV